MNFKMQAILVAIKQKREKLGYSQEYLAAKLNVSQNTYSKIELGYVQLTVERLVTICHVLNIELDELFPKKNG